MNQPNQGNNSDDSPMLSAKRKRGRPRKDQSLKRAQAARVPPGFERLNGNLPPHVDPTNDANDSMIGQTVTGVVEAAFDAGYLLAVKIGNTNTILRGLVFKPGHCAPVTPENDVAPNVKMIKRNQTKLSAGSQARVRGQNKRSRERNMQLVNYVGTPSPVAVQVLGPTPPSKGKYVPAPSVPLVGARGTVVPVVLQPVNLSNGSPANQAAQVTALKSKHVETALPLAILPPNGSTSQGLHSQPQTGPQVTPTGLRNDNGPFNKGTTQVRQGEEDKKLNPNDMHMQDEAIKGSRGSSQSSETLNGNSKPGQEIADMNEPLFVEPLQTRHSGLHFQSAPASRPVENNRTGRMSELLQALQENLGEDQVAHVDHQNTHSVVHVPKNAETRTGTKESGQSHIHSHGGSM